MHAGYNTGRVANGTNLLDVPASFKRSSALAQLKHGTFLVNSPFLGHSTFSMLAMWAPSIYSLNILLTRMKSMAAAVTKDWT